eukprot:GHVU01056012.1.p1 GENE.GHVU01056012.1~~GHVU01056012.1.p1  ORF type:complete len:427 (+),score=83.78 GHVU01056012.1:117-1283(+)
MPAAAAASASTTAAVAASASTPAAAAASEMPAAAAASVSTTAAVATSEEPAVVAASSTSTPAAAAASLPSVTAVAAVLGKPAAAATSAHATVDAPDALPAAVAASASAPPEGPTSTGALPATSAAIDIDAMSDEGVEFVFGPTGPLPRAPALPASTEGTPTATATTDQPSSATAPEGSTTTATVTGAAPTTDDDSERKRLAHLASLVVFGLSSHQVEHKNATMYTAALAPTAGVNPSSSSQACRQNAIDVEMTSESDFSSIHSSNLPAALAASTTPPGRLSSLDRPSPSSGDAVVPPPTLSAAAPAFPDPLSPRASELAPLPPIEADAHGNCQRCTRRFTARNHRCSPPSTSPSRKRRAATSEAPSSSVSDSAPASSKSAKASDTGGP